MPDSFPDRSRCDRQNVLDLPHTGYVPRGALRFVLLHPGVHVAVQKDLSVAGLHANTPRIQLRVASECFLDLLLHVTGRDAADVSVATIFGPVRSFLPVIRISAIDNPSAGMMLPWRPNEALSTYPSRQRKTDSTDSRPRVFGAVSA